MRRPTLAVAIMVTLGLMAISSPARAVTEVNSFAPSTVTTPGVWIESDVRPGGEANIVNLTGDGGDLENNQPLPVGAALLTTIFDDNAKAEVGVGNIYGQPKNIFDTISLSYSYHKAANSELDENLAAAPSLKLTFYNPECDETPILPPATAADCFATLVYEPTWNGLTSTSTQPVSTNPAADKWTTVTIDQENGLFWTTGGFGIGNSFGGPPIKTLEKWLSALSPDFQDAELIFVSVGVGTFNRGQTGYFDDVRISHGFEGGFSERYDFEPSTPSDPIQCYDVDWSSEIDRKIVKIDDQLAVRENVRMGRKAKKFCTSVIKNDEKDKNPDNTWTCYKVKGFKPERKVRVDNQVGTQWLKLDESELLCIPSDEIEVKETNHRNDD